ncbi:MAG: hypothetical protein WBX95_00050, partial [Xanthobacteraceae bacterium]
MPMWVTFLGVRDRSRNGLQGTLGVGVSTDTLEKVLDRLAVTDKATLVFERAPESKILVTSGSWDGEKVILRDQALAVGNVEGRTSHARIG